MFTAVVINTFPRHSHVPNAFVEFKFHRSGSVTAALRIFSKILFAFSNLKRPLNRDFISDLNFSLVAKYVVKIKAYEWRTSWLVRINNIK